MALTKVTGDFIETGSITQGHLHSSHGITTSHITEGDKLFFTNARVDSRVGSLSTSDLSEGTNLYFTNARAIGALTAGTNIAIASNGTISSTDTNTTYTVGDGGLTQNNFTNTLKGKLDGIATSANNYSFPYTINQAASNSTVVRRHDSGYIFANFFNTTPNTVSSGVTQVCVETGNDGYIRHGTAAAIRSFINVADGANNYTFNGTLSGDLTWGNGYKLSNGNNSNNAEILSATTGAAGIVIKDSGGTFEMQLYGNGSQYGFLTHEWGSWDLKKNNNGELILRVSGTDRTAIHSGNYSSYAVPLSGGTMSGTLTLTGGDGNVGSGLQLYETGANQYPQIFSNSAHEAMWNYRNSGSQWYVGIRSSSQLLGTTGFHFYNTTSAQTVGGFEVGGNFHTIGSVTAGGTIRSIVSQNTWGLLTNTSGTSNESGIWFTGTTARLLLRDSSGAIKSSISANGTNADNIINGHTIWHAGNDGAGSGLDADTVDGHHSSNFVRKLGLGHSAYYSADNWISFIGTSAGLYWENSIGAGWHLYPESTSSMWMRSGHTGVVRLNLSAGGTSRGSIYANNSNNVGFLDNGGNWKLRVVSADYTLSDGSSMRAPLFYDSNNTSYYVDPATTSNINLLQTAGYIQLTGSDSHIYGGSITTRSEQEQYTWDTVVLVFLQEKEPIALHQLFS